MRQIGWRSSASATRRTGANGRLSGRRCRRPDPSVKAAAWERIHGAGYGSDYLTRSALAGFQWHAQRALLLPWRERFFERVRGIYRERDLGFAQAYLRWLYPAAWAEPEVVERSQRLLDELGPDEVQLRRHLREVCDDLERAIRARAFALDPA